MPLALIYPAAIHLRLVAACLDKPPTFSGRMMWQELCLRFSEWVWCQMHSSPSDTQASNEGNRLEDGSQLLTACACQH